MSFDLQLYNSATKKVEPVRPVKEGHLGLYLCGATVSGPAHIGHVRAAVAFDVLIRWAKRCGMQVTYIRNITDIDDKILRKSQENDTEWWAWASKWERDFAQAYQSLGVIPPDFEPRATGHILDQIELVQRLVDRGHAYADGQGNVYFSVRSLPEYGSLTRQNLDDLATTEDESQLDAATEAGKRDHRDFALWKAAKTTEPETAAWDSPWGRGRPGWHLECSAMSKRYLGEEFDIHGGGIDLRFPHHENEMAQSHAAGWGFVRHWVHNAWVTAKGEKMSKSLGNGLLVNEMVAQVGAPALRVALGTVHYRSTLEWDDQTIENGQKLWDKLSGFLERAAAVSPQVAQASQAELWQLELPEAFVRAMNDDLNLSVALAQVHAALKTGQAALQADNRDELLAASLGLRAMLDVLGIDPLSAHWRGSEAAVAEGSGDAAQSALDVLISALLEERAEARAQKDWGRADALRDRIAAAGVVVEDGKDGATWRLG
ncbi:cysteine--tRNA ligase [Boudabousia liubingyangii]|uniref:cysteine--tRNA ligase n=1 Tax=Boudabousia liubingyangii TaxID=1921764 RepID=UPI00093E2D01|nr:cysteine--tRNA ligase [Boudabousia liubingyangii]OKL48365.1 cysteine--tRNA ligase [Boudabousia liubingyangii]